MMERRRRDIGGFQDTLRLRALNSRAYNGIEVGYGRNLVELKS
jgi:hypothetical protein